METNDTLMGETNDTAGPQDTAAMLSRMQLDVFEEAFKLVSKTSDEDLLVKRLQLLDIPDPGNDPRVPKVVNQNKGMLR